MIEFPTAIVLFHALIKLAEFINNYLLRKKRERRILFSFWRKIVAHAICISVAVGFTFQLTQKFIN